MSRLSDFHGIGPLANRPAAATAHALRGGLANFAITWTDSETGLLYTLDLDGADWTALNSGGAGYVPDFLALADTPNSYAGAAGKAVVVNPGGTGTDFAALPTDVFAAWRAIPGNGSKSISEFLAAMLATGASSFLALSDTPGSYAGNAGKAVRVNAAGNGLDYIPLPAGLDGGTLTLTAPALTDGAYTKNLLDLPAPSGLVNSIDGNDGVNFRILQSSGLFTQGPSSQPNYYDTVFSVGFNQGNGYTPLNPAMPSGSYRIESKFAQGGPTDPFMSEYHVASHFPVDWASPGVSEFRAITATVPHLSANYDSIHCSVGQRGAVHVVWDWAGRQRIQYDFTTAGGGVIYYLDSGSGQGHPQLVFGTNNRPVAKQLNAAANGYVILPFIDANEATAISTGTIHLAGSLRTVSFMGAKAVFAANVTGGAVDGSCVMNVASYTPVTGSWRGLDFEVQASTKVETTWVNATNGGKNGLVVAARNGDSYIEFSDQTNARQFTINHVASGPYLEVNDAKQGGRFATRYGWRIDWAKFQVSFAYPPKLPIYTVATLPSAATAGAGATCKVADANSPAFGSPVVGGGPAGVTPVTSDGSTWNVG